MLSPSLLETFAKVNLTRSPVAIGFLSEPPAGMERIDQAAAAGCGYWKLASEGRAFYTSADDHQNCPVGAFTHGVTLTPAKTAELQSLVGTMIQLQYLRSDEVPSLPHLSQPMQVAAYAPIDRATFPADVVIFRGNVRQIMLLSEAARAAGVFDTGTTMGRPACAMIPQAVQTATSIASVGCIGNRVYTELGDDELYLAVPGKALDAMSEKLGIVLTANAELEKFHRQRAASLS
jgi:uncharacterized protein (DUF169 family)